VGRQELEVRIDKEHMSFEVGVCGDGEREGTRTGGSVPGQIDIEAKRGERRQATGRCLGWSVNIS